jgi:cellobiose phosphorylase
MVMAVAKLGNHRRTWELLSMINPVNHGKSSEDIATYKTEPYVMAADVYGVSPHIGRGGWTWYTGSAGWMYQLIVESFLGLKREGNTLQLNPCVPPHWKSFEIDYRFGSTNYHIKVNLASGNEDIQTTVDGVAQSEAGVELVDDNHDHTIVYSLQQEKKVKKEKPAYVTGLQE